MYLISCSQFKEPHHTCAISFNPHNSLVHVVPSHPDEPAEGFHCYAGGRQCGQDVKPSDLAPKKEVTEYLNPNTQLIWSWHPSQLCRRRWRPRGMPRAFSSYSPPEPEFLGPPRALILPAGAVQPRPNQKPSELRAYWAVEGCHTLCLFLPLSLFLCGLFFLFVLMFIV